MQVLAYNYEGDGNGNIRKKAYAPDAVCKDWRKPTANAAGEPFECPTFKDSAPAEVNKYAATLFPNTSEVLRSQPEDRLGIRAPKGLALKAAKLFEFQKHMELCVVRASCDYFHLATEETIIADADANLESANANLAAIWPNLTPWTKEQYLCWGPNDKPLVPPLSIYLTDKLTLYVGTCEKLVDLLTLSMAAGDAAFAGLFGSTAEHRFRALSGTLRKAADELSTLLREGLLQRAEANAEGAVRVVTAAGDVWWSVRSIDLSIFAEHAVEYGSDGSGARKHIKKGDAATIRLLEADESGRMLVPGSPDVIISLSAEANAVRNLTWSAFRDMLAKLCIPLASKARRETQAARDHRAKSRAKPGRKNSEIDAFQRALEGCEASLNVDSARDLT